MTAVAVEDSEVRERIMVVACRSGREVRRWSSWKDDGRFRDMVLLFSFVASAVRCSLQ